MPPLRDKSKSLLVLLTLTLAAAAAASDAAATVHFHPTAEAAAAAHCEGTLYPELCLSTLADIPNLHKKPLPDVICATVNRTKAAVTTTASNCSSYLQDKSLTARDRLAISDCMELLGTTMDELQSTTSDLESPSATNASASLGAKRVTMDHVMTVLSAAITNQYTCLDGFSYQNDGKVRRYMEPSLYHVSRMVSNSLAMAKKLPGAGGGGSRPSPSPSATPKETESAQRQPFMRYGQMVKGFPRWVKPGDRRLLQAPASGITADAVVAKDGSGTYTTVSAAVAAAPTNSKKRYVIYIKAGAYLENVEVGKNHRNLMFIGDGIGKTVIKASRNVVDGSTTFRSATVAEMEAYSAMASPIAMDVDKLSYDVDKLSYEIFSLLESKFLFGGAGCLSGPGTPARPFLGARDGQVRVLAIDGCGEGAGDALLVVATLTRLEAGLLQRAGSKDARVADFFDMVVGAGAGGVLAAMPLFRGLDRWLRYTAEEALAFVAGSVGREWR